MGAVIWGLWPTLPLSDCAPAREFDRPAKPRGLGPDLCIMPGEPEIWMGSCAVLPLNGRRRSALPSIEASYHEVQMQVPTMVRHADASPRALSVAQHRGSTCVRQKSQSCHYVGSIK